jgi:hypothetical protein
MQMRVIPPSSERDAVRVGMSAERHFWESPFAAVLSLADASFSTRSCAQPAPYGVSRAHRRNPNQSPITVKGNGNGEFK